MSAFLPFDQGLVAVVGDFPLEVLLLFAGGLLIVVLLVFGFVGDVVVPRQTKNATTAAITTIAMIPIVAAELPPSRTTTSRSLAMLQCFLHFSGLIALIPNAHASTNASPANHPG
ncbi:MAG: hypothetical protein JOZ38_06725 [Candidatus Eremiobacteraeota bacterium]|nr:hypothetical protein [Candidatus Eremiobacteraeota bacterium]